VLEFLGYWLAGSFNKAISALLVDDDPDSDIPFSALGLKSLDDNFLFLIYP
jgi:hypothetical protein